MSDETPEDRFQAWCREQPPLPKVRGPTPASWGMFGWRAPLGLAIVAVGLILYAIGVIGPNGWLLR